MDENCVSFVNKEYKKEWAEWVPGFEGKVRYSDGTYHMNLKGQKVVYDGATNMQGYVNPDGTFESCREGEDYISEYEMSFLRAARDN